MVDIKRVKAPEVAFIDTATLAVLFNAPVDVLIVDARGVHEDLEYIPGSVTLEDDVSEAAIKETLGADTDRLIVTVCYNLHCPRSFALYKRLKEMGYENVLEYADGVGGWKAAGYPAGSPESSAEECPGVGAA